MAQTLKRRARRDTLLVPQSGPPFEQGSRAQLGTHFRTRVRARQEFLFPLIFFFALLGIQQMQPPQNNAPGPSPVRAVNASLDAFLSTAGLLLFAPNTSARVGSPHLSHLRPLID
jgi:hypothetical protein